MREAESAKCNKKSVKAVPREVLFEQAPKTFLEPLSY